MFEKIGSSDASQTADLNLETTLILLLQLRQRRKVNLDNKYLDNKHFNDFYFIIDAKIFFKHVFMENLAFLFHYKFFFVML